jgi:hypothetical protein
LEEFRYLGTILTNQNSVHEEIQTILQSDNACYYLVQKLLSFSLLSKYLKTKIYSRVFFLVVLCRCETLSVTWREERRLRVFANRVLRRIFGLMRDEVTGKRGKLRNEEINDLY